VTLTVDDGREGLTVAHADISIYNRLPVANAGGPYNTKPGIATAFDGSASSDADTSDVLTYIWTFGDNTDPVVGTAQISHLYANLGTYQVILKVQDNLGGTSRDTTTAVISNNLLPIVELHASEMSVIGTCTDTYQIDFTIDSATDPDGSVVSYSWDFDDGSPTSNSSSTVSHTFAVPGVYDVTLSVTDNEGAVTIEALRISLTADQPPAAAFSVPKDTVAINTNVTFNASASSDVDGGISTYVWNFGDGTVVTEYDPVAAHSYQTTGTAQVQLTVSDGCGKIGTASKFLRVEPSVGVEDTHDKNLPAGFGLSQNYPNPISLRGTNIPVTRIDFSLPKSSDVQMAIYNIFGQQVRRLARGMHGAGTHSAAWDLRDDKGELVTTGVYFYRLQAGEFLGTKKLVITK
jgi:PKD repeat protein